MEVVVQRRKLYSAVPGRHFVVVHSYHPQAEGEITLYKNDRVKGETLGSVKERTYRYNCIMLNTALPLDTFVTQMEMSCVCS